MKLEMKNGQEEDGNESRSKWNDDGHNDCCTEDERTVENWCESRIRGTVDRHDNCTVEGGSKPEKLKIEMTTGSEEMKADMVTGMQKIVEKMNERQKMITKQAEIEENVEKINEK